MDPDTESTGSGNLGTKHSTFDKGRSRWSSRPAFLVAAIGSAIGFGNIWRFPTLSYQYGGGAFFIPYFMALCLIGIPLLILEVTIGQYYQSGDVGSFGGINKHFRGIGLASVLCSFVLNCYYTNLIAWCVIMFFRSATGNAGWHGVNETEAIAWFTNTVTGASTVGDSLEPTRLVWVNVAALAFVWACIFASLAFGVKWTGRIAYITVGLPVLMLMVLLVRSATLEGAGDGVKAFIGQWDMKVLSERPDVWTTAVTQVFFSIGVTTGVMTAYGSYNERNLPVFSNSFIIATANSCYSFLAGFAVFSTVGYIANKEGVKISELQGIGGPGLIFGVFPVALGTLSGAGHWERLLFVVLFMLGIDSAFSLCEAVVTVVKDTVLFNRTRRFYVTGLVCGTGFLCSLLFATDAGYYFLDVADFYINFMFLVVGVFECFTVGWMYDWADQSARLGFKPLASLLTTAFFPVIVASSLWFGLESEPESWSRGDWRLLWGFIAFILLTLIGMATTFVLAKMEMASGIAAGLTQKEYWTELLMGNMLLFRRRLLGVVRYIPFPWFVMIRWFIPQILMVLFANLCASKDPKSGDPTFGGYGGYSTRYQAFGIFIFSTAVVAIAAGIIMPSLYSCFFPKVVSDPEEESSEEQETLSSEGTILK